MAIKKDLKSAASSFFDGEYKEAGKHMKNAISESAKKIKQGAVKVHDAVERRVTMLDQYTIRQLNESFKAIDEKMASRDVKNDANLTAKLQALKNRITAQQIKTMNYYNKNKTKYPEIARSNMTYISILQMKRIIYGNVKFTSGGQGNKFGEYNFIDAAKDARGFAIGLCTTAAIVGATDLIATKVAGKAVFGLGGKGSFLAEAIKAMFAVNPAATIALVSGIGVAGLWSLLHKANATREMINKHKQIANSMKIDMVLGQDEAAKANIDADNKKYGSDFDKKRDEILQQLKDDPALYGELLRRVQSDPQLSITARRNLRAILKEHKFRELVEEAKDGPMAEFVENMKNAKRLETERKKYLRDRAIVANLGGSVPADEKAEETAKKNMEDSQAKADEARTRLQEAQAKEAERKAEFEAKSQAKKAQDEKIANLESEVEYLRKEAAEANWYAEAQEEAPADNRPTKQEAEELKTSKEAAEEAYKTYYDTFDKAKQLPKAEAAAKKAEDKVHEATAKLEEAKKADGKKFEDHPLTKTMNTLEQELQKPNPDPKTVQVLFDEMKARAGELGVDQKQLAQLDAHFAKLSTEKDAFLRMIGKTSDFTASTKKAMGITGDYTAIQQEIVTAQAEAKKAQERVQAAKEAAEKLPEQRKALDEADKDFEEKKKKSQNKRVKDPNAQKAAESAQHRLDEAEKRLEAERNKVPEEPGEFVPADLSALEEAAQTAQQEADDQKSIHDAIVAGRKDPQSVIEAKARMVKTEGHYGMSGDDLIAHFDKEIEKARLESTKQKIIEQIMAETGLDVSDLRDAKIADRVFERVIEREREERRRAAQQEAEAQAQKPNAQEQGNA